MLSPEQDAALSPRAEARAWQHHLLAAGLLADLPAPMTEGPGAPIPRLREATHALERLEDERRALSQLHGLKTGGVPNWVWALLFLSFCFGLFFANFVMVIFIGSVPFGLLSLIGLGFVAVAESRRRERLAAVDATIQGVRQALFDDHRALLRGCFFAGGALLMAADAVTRALSGPLGSEAPVGALTALVGGPFFLVMLRQLGPARR